ncbi:MAG: hypothetical protein QNJ46_19485 [Leptolyngbyaceae cyanobacterium MO_188.B28]|nr:hypothetical protein [Leptolyngbyaceae cyanobacterium MO_188.B28]
MHLINLIERQINSDTPAKLQLEVSMIGNVLAWAELIGANQESPSLRP